MANSSALSKTPFEPFRGGRVLAVCGVPGEPERFYFGSVNGGVWENPDAGLTWRPIFIAACSDCRHLVPSSMRAYSSPQNSTRGGIMLRRRLSLCAVVLFVSVAAFAQPVNYTFSHFAGPQSGPGSVDGTGSAAQFAFPVGVAVDQLAGNVYIADTFNQTIRKVTPAGVVTTLAGQPTVFGFADGTGSAARFSFPRGIAVAVDGTIYLADTNNDRIRRVTAAGVVTTFAGSGASGSQDGSATTATFFSLVALAFDRATGNLYAADNQTIRKITPAGAVTTIAGAPGLSGAVDANGSLARFNFGTETGLAVDSSGNVYVADSNNFAVRKVAPNGDVTTFAGTMGQSGNVDATGTAARFGFLGALTIDAGNNLYVNDRTFRKVRKITSAGVATTFAGGTFGISDGIGTSAQFMDPRGIDVDRNGNLYLTDAQSVRSVSSAAVVTTIAGQPILVGTTDAAGAAARFNFPQGAVADASGNVYVADTNNSRIRKISTAGAVTTLAGSSSGFADGTGSAAMFRSPSGIGIDGVGNLYVADSSSSTVRVITPQGAVTTLAGSDTLRGSTDAVGAAARFSFSGLSGVAVDSGGNVFVADSNNHTIRKIAPGGAVTTFAGSAGLAGFADGTGTAARFNFPQGLTIATSGNLFVADLNNERIRMVTPAGVVTTIAGGSFGANDGFGTSAQFINPRGITIDSTGTLFVTDFYTIRRVTQAGVVTRIAGQPFVLGIVDGVGRNATFHDLRGITVDAAGNLFVAEAQGEDIRRGAPAGCTPPSAAITTASAICGNALGIGSVPDAGPGATYTWSISGGSFTSPSNGSTVTFRAGATGTVTLNAMVVNSSSCPASSSANVTINALPSATITLSPSGNMCPGNTMTASVPDAGAGASYFWVVPGGTITSGAGTNTITFTAAVLGSVLVTVRNASGCASTGSIGIPTALVVTIDKQGFPAAGDTGTVTVTNPNACTFTSSSSASWLTITAGGSGSGSGAVTFAVAANSTSAPRTALLTVAGFRFRIYQAGTAATDLQSYTISHLAGNVTGAGYADGTGSAARFSYPLGNAMDSSGNIFVADWGNHVIRKITPTGVVTTFAGAIGLHGSADGTGTAARFHGPQGIAMDANGNLYVSDTNNFTIRKITPAGVVTTVAGLAGISGSVDATGSAARFSFTFGLVVAASGNIYVADAGASTIRQITPTGVVTTLAGAAFTSGELDGTGSAARFDDPEGITIDAAGNLYVADGFAATIRKIAPGGVVTTFAGQAYYFSNVDGTGTAARFGFPAGIAIDSSGNLYVTDFDFETIRKITPSAVVSTLAGGTFGSADGTGSAAQFNFDEPNGLSVDAAGNLLVIDADNHTLRKVTSAGVVTTFVGTAPTIGAADGTGSSASFNFPEGVAVDGSGNAYVADSDNEVIRKITSSGAVTTIAGTVGVFGSADGPAGSASFRVPIGIAVDSSGTVYVSDVSANTIRKISAGNVTTLAGNAGFRGSTDGTGAAALFSSPRGIALDSSGNVYVADTGNQTIRKITPAGVVSTLAGSAGTPGYADGVGTAALFRNPQGVAVDASGNVYVADFSNSVLRKITPTGTVTTLAGSSGSFVIVDGTGTQAGFSSPRAVSVDTLGNLFVAEASTIRKVTSAGVVTTVAGLPTTRGNVDGTGSAARLDIPFGIAVDTSGKLYIADSFSDAIRVGTIAGLKGDANGDGVVTVTDVFYLINFLFANGPAPRGPADVNGDGQVTVTDVFYLINYLFAGGPPPRALPPVSPTSTGAARGLRSGNRADNLAVIRHARGREQ